MVRRPPAGDAGGAKIRVCRVYLCADLRAAFSVGYGGGSNLGDASGGWFLQYASPENGGRRHEQSPHGVARRSGRWRSGSVRWMMPNKETLPNPNLSSGYRATGGAAPLGWEQS